MLSRIYAERMIILSNMNLRSVKTNKKQNDPDVWVVLFFIEDVVIKGRLYCYNYAILGSMPVKIKEKEQAIQLRKQGKTYNEILEVVQVSKSTLSLWLRDVGLSVPQKQKITALKIASQKRGASRRHEICIQEIDTINQACKQDITSIAKRELFMIGLALYWAEGAKKNGTRAGVMVDFGNTDPAMLKMFILWLYTFTKTTSEDIVLHLHLHENHAQRETSIIVLWARELGMTVEHFGKTMFKKHNPKTVRKKVDDSYIGLVSIRVKKSTTLNRRIMGWIYAIIATQK